MRVDSVAAFDGAPPIVTVADVHGYPEAARRALSTLEDHPAFDPVVVEDGGELRWAGNDYVLVFNGDVVNRGPDSAGALALVDRLREQAPPGRVRYTIGNHETSFLFRDVYGRGHWFTDRASETLVDAFLGDVVAGRVTAAFEGHRHVHVHAGHPDGVDVAAANDGLEAAARRLRAALGTADSERVQHEVFESHPGLFGDRDGEEPGILTATLPELPIDAPPQIVGHTPQTRPRRRGDVVCGDLILAAREDDGNEGVTVETPAAVWGVCRTDDGVERRRLERAGGR